ncbi:MAG: amidoligase family protein, partial [Bacteroidota bacterium]
TEAGNLGFVGIPTGCSHFEKVVRGIIGKTHPNYIDSIKPSVQSRRYCRDLSPPKPFLERMKRITLTPAAFHYEKAIGIELEGFTTHTFDEIETAIPYFARVVSDGSIRTNNPNENPAEIKAVFPRGTLEPRLYQLTKTLRGLGMKCNKSCGLHVHFDMRNRTAEEVLKLAKRADKWVKALQELVPMSRRDQHYCKFGISASGNDRYKAVNFAAYHKYKTLEIRLHSATFDYAKILSWIRLCELILAIRYNPKEADCLGTLGQLPLMDYEASYWKARHRSINPSQYDTKTSTTEENE